MPSQEFKQILEVWAKPNENAKLSIAEQRAGMEAATATLPTAEGVSFEKLMIDKMAAEWIIPLETTDDTVILYFHGGGHCVGSIATHRSLVSFMAKFTKVKALMIDYRLSPENPFPAAVEDGVSAFRFLLGQGVSPSSIVISGDSAGGNLTMATLLDLKDKGDPMPAAAVVLSPWVDMEGIGKSMETNAAIDPFIQKDTILSCADMYLNGINPRTQLAAPIYADLSGLPPLLIQVGSAETLLDDAIRLSEKAKEAGVDVGLEEYEDMVHVWQVLVGLTVPESVEAVKHIAQFIRRIIAD